MLKRKASSDILKVVPLREPKGAEHPEPISDVLPKHEFSMLMIAPRGSGKTTLILNLVTKMYKGFFHRIYVFSPTMAGDPKWEAAKKIKGVLGKNKNDPDKAGKKGKSLDEEEEDEDDPVSDEDSEEERGGGRGGHKKSLYSQSWSSLFAKVTPEPRQMFDGVRTTRDLWEFAKGDMAKSAGSKEKKFTGRLQKKDMFRDYDEDDLTKIMNETMDKIDKLRKKGWTKHKADRQLIIFDDLVGSTLFSAKRNNPFRRLNTTLRHYSTSVMMVSQGYKEVPKTARVNSTCVILFRIANEAEIKSIYEENSCGLNEEEWRRVYEYCTKDPFSFLLINYGKPEKERMWRNFDEMIPINPQFSADKKRKEDQHDAAIAEEKVPTGE